MHLAVGAMMNDITLDIVGGSGVDLMTHGNNIECKITSQPEEPVGVEACNQRIISVLP